MKENLLENFEQLKVFNISGVWWDKVCVWFSFFLNLFMVASEMNERDALV